MLTYTMFASQKTRSVSKIITIKNLLAFFAVCFFCSISATEVYADIHTAASCSRADVSSAITAASAGDTVSVPAGSATWSSDITITKGINLIGAGIGSTVITAPGGAIYYTPSNYSLNTPFRVSGFTFSLGGSSSSANLIDVGGNPTSPYHPGPAQTKIRIDHNRFTNGANCNTSVHAIVVRGAMYGVADNNTFDTIHYPLRFDPSLSGGSAGGQWSWNNWSLTFGAVDDNFYFEDNTISWGSSGCGDATCIACQYSGRYAFRYNTFTQAVAGQPMCDMHGNQGGGTGDENAMWSCFGGELYGNQINTGGHGGKWLNQRGGETLSFCNNFNGVGMSFDITEEHRDSEEPTTNPEPQWVHNSYFWNNRVNLTGSLIGLYITTQISEGQALPTPSQNQNFWTDITDEGTVGVFCGTLANRPATCTVGQGYWATNQSCSNLTGMVGVNPASPLDGILYKCTATNTWTEYYTPLPYPHPLRKPNPPMGVRIQ